LYQRYDIRGVGWLTRLPDDAQAGLAADAGDVVAEGDIDLFCWACCWPLMVATAVWVKMIYVESVLKEVG